MGNIRQKSGNIIETARLMGVSLAGITTVASLQNAPSYQVYGHVKFPPAAKSILVLALAHNEENPELDWWGVKGGTSGNRRLQEISHSLTQLLNKEYNISAKPAPYAVEDGGIFLKDAAVLAGLGIIGANNLLITKEFGPRIRLRALFLEANLTPTEPEPFSPCKDCDMPCKPACPRDAFSSGSYSVDLCRKQMQEDEANKIIVANTTHCDSPGVRIKYCRGCELNCRAGKKGMKE